MFILDFKPTFYSYPLTPQQYTKIKQSQKQVMQQLNIHQRQLQQTLLQTKYFISYKASRDNYNDYRQRLQQKISILQQQLKQYRQITNCHQQIDNDLKRHKMQRSQIKHKLLDVYKKAINDKHKIKSLQRENNQLQKVDGNYFNDQNIYGKKSEIVSLSDRMARKEIPQHNYNTHKNHKLSKYSSQFNTKHKTNINPQNYSSFKSKIKMQQLKLPAIRPQHKEDNFIQEVQLDISRHKIYDPSVFRPKMGSKKDSSKGRIPNFGLF